MDARRLPVAPRPFREETLSSWLGRVACRYGLDAPTLAACLASRDAPSAAWPPPIDDISPSSDQIDLWARACAVDPARLRRMALGERHPRRTLAWFANRGLAAAWAPAPVCLACFDADRVAGRDGHCRANWLLAERCVCPAHGRMLIDQCPHCHGRLRVAFRLRENLAAAVCARCAEAFGDRGGQGDGALRGMANALLAIQARIAAALDHVPMRRSRLEEVIAMLWAPVDDPGASRPVLELWVSGQGWRLPVEARQAVGRSTPLGQLRVPFRGLTLVALHDLCGGDISGLDEAPGRADWLFGRAAPRRPGRAKTLPARVNWGKAERRSPGDYLPLAREILAHPDWVAAARLPERRRRRVRGRLIDKALEAGFGPKFGTGERAGEPVQRSNANAV